MKKISVATLVFGLCSIRALALPEYREIDGCGSAEVVSGDTCSNVKVQFHFQGCQIKGESRLATRIVCERSMIKARFDEADIRLEARFDKQDDGWGGVLWSPNGAVHQYTKIGKVAVGESKKKSHPTVGPIESAKKARVSVADPLVNRGHSAPPNFSLNLGSSAKPNSSANAGSSANLNSSADSSSSANPSPSLNPHLSAGPERAPAAQDAAAFKASGYADFRFTDFKTYEDPNVPSGGAHESGFGLEEGAFYLNYEKDNLSAVLDLAFRRGKDSDTNPAAATPNQSSNSNFGVGVDHSQLYLKYKVADSLALDAGQFDTFYGVELNDSKDRVFGKTGLVYDYTLPVTHTGLMAELSVGSLTTKIFAANPNNKGSLGTSTTGDEKTEYGGALSFAGSVIRGQLGVMGRPIRRASGLGDGNRLLLDILLGATFGAWNIDFEFARVADPSKNTLTNSDVSDEESAGLGFLALVGYQLNDLIFIGLRYEQLQNDPSGTLSISRGSSMGESLHIKLRSELELRAEFIDMRFAGAGAQEGQAWHDTRFSGGVVWKLP